MVYVEDDQTSLGRIELACDIAHMFDAGLIGISANVPDAPVLDPYSAAEKLRETWRKAGDPAADELERAESRFRHIVGVRPCRVEWRKALSFPAETVAKESRAADLIIIGRDSFRPPPRLAPDPGEVLLLAGRPVLVVPSEQPQGQILSHVLVAWKDCREARRAVVDALPLLCRAERVTVLRRMRMNLRTEVPLKMSRALLGCTERPPSRLCFRQTSNRQPSGYWATLKIMQSA